MTKLVCPVLLFGLRYRLSGWKNETLEEGIEWFPSLDGLYIFLESKVDSAGKANLPCLEFRIVLPDHRLVN